MVELYTNTTPFIYAIFGFSVTIPLAFFMVKRVLKEALVEKMTGVYKHSESGIVKKEPVIERKVFEILPQKVKTVIWNC
jgi:hypothetical protein